MTNRLTPYSIVKDTFLWFHQSLGHLSETSLHKTIEAHYHNHNFRCKCDHFKCGDCEKHKLDNKGYGLLPERKVTSRLFEDAAVDLIVLSTREDVKEGVSLAK